MGLKYVNLWISYHNNLAVAGWDGIWNMAAAWLQVSSAADSKDEGRECYLWWTRWDCCCEKLPPTDLSGSSANRLIARPSTGTESAAFYRGPKLFSFLSGVRRSYIRCSSKTIPLLASTECHPRIKKPLRNNAELTHIGSLSFYPLVIVRIMSV